MSEPKNPTDAGISRRGFLQTSVAGGVAALAGTTACTPRGQAPAESDAPANPPFELAEKTVPELQEMMESGQYTARAITELYLTRIEAIDRQGPTLRSIIETNPDALEIADELDAERRDNGPRGPLHGIPVILKDNIATADRMTTTAGSLALEGCVPAEDAFVAKKLREAGAILLAKANLSEWANFRSTRSSSGWSAQGGQCRNPYALDRNPCGSSSGSGAATSANLGAVSIGTETDGSIVCPSNANGLVGFKPTIGLVSRAGIIPISHHQDSAGPMVRSVVDAAIVMSALTGVDPSDQPTAASDGNTHPDYTTFLDVKGLDGARIGVVRALFGFHSEVDRVMEEALDVMKRQGAEVIDPVELPPRDDFRESEFTVMLFEFKADLNKYLAELGDAAPHRTLAEIIQFNEDNKGREMPYFGQEIFLQAEEKGPLTSQEYLDALANNHRVARTEGIDAAVAEHRLAALIAPTGGPAWMTDLVNGDHFGGGSSSTAAVAGYPIVTVPAGLIHGLPVGVSFFGPAWSEPSLFKLAYGFEQASRHRTEPTLRATVGG